MDAALKQKIEQMVASDRVVLFMKGTRDQPRCGFSAAVVEMLDELVPSYATFDVLADPALREGIKAFSEWPTIPQLYIGGEFIGGSDIAKDMYASGQLHQKLGTEKKAAPALSITVTDKAAAILVDARKGEPSDRQFLRLSVNARWQHGLSFGPELPGDAAASSAGLDIRVDAGSIKRAAGVVIDFVDGPPSGFKITNPNEPAKVKQLKVKDLKSRMDDAKAKGAPLKLFDVRTQGEWDKAHIDGATLVDDKVRASILELPKSTPLYFQCHHGGRSQAAAEHYLSKGFTEVYNVEGGIDAWSQEVDKSVPRY